MSSVAEVSAGGVALIVLLALVTCFLFYYFFGRRLDKRIILGILGLFLFAYAIRLVAMLQVSLVYGIDGPWYIIQVNNILQTGAMSEFTGIFFP